jgi:hypothetical protein
MPIGGCSQYAFRRAPVCPGTCILTEPDKTATADFTLGTRQDDPTLLKPYARFR